MNTETARQLMLTVPEGAGRLRLDKFLGEALREHDISREKIKKVIQDGGCLVDGEVITSANNKVGAGQHIVLSLPIVATSVQPEEGELDVLYQDEYLLVLNKPAGLTVHPAPSCPDGTLVHRLVAQYPSLREQEGFRPGIVHRLDKDTSGLLCVALTEECRLRLSTAFAQREVYKEYLALVQGQPTPTGDIDAPLGRHPSLKIKVAVLPHGKPASSSWRVLHQGQDYALVAVRIHTGRTHQIRVHMAHSGHPLWGDSLYGGAQRLPSGRDVASRQMLHAWKLQFTHPFTGEELRFTCPPPEDCLQAALTLEQGMRRVVVTGVAGSGKSQFVRCLHELGIPTWSADAAVSRLYEPQQNGWLALRQRYGDAFTPDERSPVDRKLLARAIMQTRGSAPVGEFDETLPAVEVQELNRLLHPLVLHDLENFWTQQEQSGCPLAVAEVPLWFESLARQVQEQVAQWRNLSVVGVYCEEQERQRRLHDLRGWSPEQIQMMDALQWSQDRKMALCTHRIDNTGSPEALRLSARSFIEKIEEEEHTQQEGFCCLWRKVTGSDS